MLRWLAGFMAFFCLFAVARIEWLDERAGGAIQEKLMLEPDLKWVIHKTLDPKLELKNSVGLSLMTFGVSVHVVAIILIFLSLFRQARDGPWRSGWAALASLGMILLVWVFYRQYFAALGW